MSFLLFDYCAPTNSLCPTCAGGRPLQLNVGGHCFLLSTGDHATVPSHTVFSLANHSGDVEAAVAFAVFKHGGDE